jgi:O-antigen/teichoic acid export membrane protein
LNHIKSLGGQTIVYGLSSFVPKFLTYLLNPVYAYTWGPEQVGRVTILYTYVIFLNIVLTYGMETGFFFFSKRETKSDSVFGTSFISLFFSTLVFVIGALIFLKPIAGAIEFTANPRYIIWFIFILGFDTLSALPFSKLRLQNKAFRFAFIKLIGVVFNVLLNVFLILIIPKFLLSNQGTFLGFHYHLDIEIIFICNFCSSLLVLLILLPEILKEKLKFDPVLLRQLFVYSLPLMIAGLAGTINDTFDRILLQYFLPAGVNSQYVIGIYGANIKLAVLMTLFTQMFRFAAEPFFFNQKKGDDQHAILADVSKYFIIYGLVIFLTVISFTDILKYFVGPKVYWEGLKVVPIYMFAKLFLGIYFNLSFWFKLSGKTYFGIIITAVGAIITIVLNILLIPVMSYLGCALVQLFTYVVMVLLSYFIGKKYYKIPYDFKNIFLYMGIAIAIYIFAFHFSFGSIYVNLLKNTIALVLFLVYLEKREHIFSLFLKK